jgi:hypothetical protein
MMVILISTSLKIRTGIHIFNHQVLTVASMKMPVFWDIVLHSLVETGYI